MSRLLPGLAALRGCGAAPLAPLARVRPTALAAQSAARLSTSSSPRPTIPSTRVLTQDTLRALWAKQPSSSPSPLASQGSMTQRLLQRAFSSSPIGRIRDHYYRSGGGGGRGGGGRQKPGWFAELRGRVNRWNPLYVVYAIMAANIAVFLMWQYAISSYQRFRDPALYNWMFKNFILSEMNMKAGRLWTIVTSTFSQMSTSHIFFNLLGLYFMAPAVAGLLGTFNFLGLYFGGGIFAGLCSLAYQHLNRKPGRVSGSEGASGAIYSCLAFYGTIFPQATFLLFFVVPMRAWMVVGGLFAWDFWQAATSRQGLTDSAGHAGGIAFGVLAALYARQKYLGNWRRGFRM